MNIKTLLIYFKIKGFCFESFSMDTDDQTKLYAIQINISVIKYIFYGVHTILPLYLCDKVMWQNKSVWQFSFLELCKIVS